MVDYDEHTALLVVDVQNDFADPDGSLYVHDAQNAISAINDEIRHARDAGALVVYTQDWHPEHTPHFEQDGGVWPAHCVGETWGAQLHPDVAMLEDAPRVRKGTGGEDGYSSFSMRDPESGELSSTELATLLLERDVERLVIVGIATDYCVKETVLDAARLGFETTVIERGIRAVELEPGDAERALEAMREAGAQIE